MRLELSLARIKDAFYIEKQASKVTGIFLRIKTSCVQQKTAWGLLQQTDVSGAEGTQIFFPFIYSFF